MPDNPFFQPWPKPEGYPPFDLIRTEHFAPALDRGMEVHQAEIAAIADNPEPPTFANTIEALERAGRLLRRVNDVFGNYTGTCITLELQQIDRVYAPKLAAHYVSVTLNQALFTRISDLFARRDTLGLDAQQMRLLERYNLDYIRGGAKLANTDRDRMTAISERLATLETQFGENVLHDEDEWYLALGPDDLEGLPGSLIKAAAVSAREKGLDGKYLITLPRSSIEPFLAFSSRRDLRQVAYEAFTQRGSHVGPYDNRPLIPEILALRTEQARLLGYGTYADYKLADSMAGSVAAANGLLEQVFVGARGKAVAEQADLEEIARAEGMNAPIEGWDWRYYAEKVRKAKYDLDEAEIRPYFVLDNMVQAIFYTAGRLFDVSFRPRPDLPVYHADVKAYEMMRAGQTVAYFLHDNFARTGKRSGAWMSSYQSQSTMDGSTLPIIVNVNNFQKAEPTLLSFDDARTLFHEFGHGLHGMLNDTRYPSQSNNGVRLDFLEFQSQMYEHWLSTPEILNRFARHHQTGEALPEVLVKRLLAAGTFNQGFVTTEFTAAALLDFRMHRLADPATLDIDTCEQEFRAEIGMPDAIAIRHRPTQFQHLFSGNYYAAGYYVYMWAATLDADGFEAFQEAGDPFDPVLAAKLKDMYSSGDTRDPMELYKAFRGREPRTEALLKQKGLMDGENFDFAGPIPAANKVIRRNPI